jgi:hypothetical protein
MFSVERRAFAVRRELHSVFAAVKDLSKQLCSRVRAALSRRRLWIDCSVAVLGFPCDHVTPHIGIVIDRFTHVSHTKYADMITKDVDKEL